jgi:hypothetical protein
MASRARARTVRNDPNDVRQAVHQHFALELWEYANIHALLPHPWLVQIDKFDTGAIVKISAAASTTPTTPGCLCSANRIRRFRATPSANPVAIDSCAIVHSAEIPVPELSTNLNLSFRTPLHEPDQPLVAPS